MLLQQKYLTTSAKSLVALVLLTLSGISNGLFAQNWDEVVKAVASDRAAFDLFDYSVSISGDYAIVGAKQEDHPEFRFFERCFFKFPSSILKIFLYQ